MSTQVGETFVMTPSEAQSRRWRNRGTSWIGEALLALGLLNPMAAGAEPIQTVTGSTETAQKLVEAAYDQRRVQSMKVTMTVRLLDGKREWKRDALLFIKRRTEVDDNQLFKFTAPPDLADSAVLTREQHDSDDEQWVYLPAYHMVRRIAPASRGDAYLGTDYFYEDVLTLRWKDYNFRELGHEKIREFDCIEIEAVPVAPKLLASTAYSRTIFWIEPHRKLIVKQEFFDRAGKLMKVMQNFNLKSYGRYLLWDRTIMENVQTHHKTVVETGRREIDISLPEDIFTQKALKRG